MGDADDTTTARPIFANNAPVDVTSDTYDATTTTAVAAVENEKVVANVDTTTTAAAVPPPLRDDKKAEATVPTVRPIVKALIVTSSSQDDIRPSPAEGATPYDEPFSQSVMVAVYSIALGTALAALEAGFARHD